MSNSYEAEVLSACAAVVAWQMSRLVLVDIEVPDLNILRLPEAKFSEPSEDNPPTGRCRN